MLAEKAAGMPGNIADAVNGCWQCHGSHRQVQARRQGRDRPRGAEGKPVLDPDTWPNSGIGRLNPDGSKGSCHACHSRHSFEAKLSRSPENCGKCHMGPDHPQIEIYNESQARHRLPRQPRQDGAGQGGDWVLGKDYSAAPTCATCHISSYMTPNGVAKGNSHDVGERISWTLRPVGQRQAQPVIFDGRLQGGLPGDASRCPKSATTVATTEKVVENEKLVSKSVKRKVAKIVTWQERRDTMKGVCLQLPRRRPTWTTSTSSSTAWSCSTTTSSPSRPRRSWTS